MTHGPLHVIFEDNHLLVVSKPAGLPTMGVEEGRESLLSVARKYIGLKYHKPGNVYLGVVSRLDSPVTGVVVFARTSKAARRLTELFRCRQVLKTYWALVDRPPIPPAGVLLDWVRKDERHQRMVSAPPETPDAQEARLRYRTVRSCPQAVLLEIQLETGRTAPDPTATGKPARARTRGPQVRKPGGVRAGDRPARAAARPGPSRPQDAFRSRGTGPPFLASLWASLSPRYAAATGRGSQLVQ